MRLAQYLCTTYLWYFCTISVVLCSIYNLIELTERMVYAPHVATAKALLFITLNIVPTWLSTLPIICWLSTLATLHHISSRNELTTCWVLGITPYQIIAPLVKLLAGLLFTILVAKHCCFDWIHWQSKQYYQKTYHGIHSRTVYNLFHVTSSGMMCYAAQYNQSTNQGTGLLLSTNAQQIVAAPRFTTVGPMIYLAKAADYKTQQGTKPKHALTYHVPTFIANLQKQKPPSSLADLLLEWWHSTSHDKNRLEAKIAQDIQPLAEAFFFALLCLLIFLYTGYGFRACIGSYPAIFILQSGVCMLLTPFPLLSALLAAGCCALLFSFAKGKNSSILRVLG